MPKLYFRQLLAGRDFAQHDKSALHMGNFVYLIGDQESKECLVIDPAWDIAGIIKIAQADNMKIVGALATHYHPDHVGGTIFDMTIEGLPELLAQNPCRIHAHKLEKPGIMAVTHVSDADITAHESGDKIKVGVVEVEILHTPGHTPGSCCFRVNNSLVSGDTLFLRGCGRVDLPGGNVDEMYRTIHERFNTIKDNTVVYPGHNYSGDHESMSNLRKNNPVFSYLDIKSFRRLFS
jgi:glyoxylase-like metal-dependent hydrolase (beta-lactamase superfamily II)